MARPVEAQDTEGKAKPRRQTPAEARRPSAKKARPAAKSRAEGRERKRAGQAGPQAATRRPQERHGSRAEEAAAPDVKAPATKPDTAAAAGPRPDCRRASRPARPRAPHPRRHGPDAPLLAGHGPAWLGRPNRAGRDGREPAGPSDDDAGASPAGDVDVNIENAYFSGDEAPGGDNQTPDQDVVDDIGRALGVEYQDSEELRSSDKVGARDRHRWELDPASAEDYKERKIRTNSKGKT